MYAFQQKLATCNMELNKWNRERPKDDQYFLKAEADYNSLQLVVDQDPSNLKLYDQMLYARHKVQV